MKREFRIERYNFSMVVLSNPKKANIVNFKSITKTKSHRATGKNVESSLWKAVIMQAVLDLMTNSKRASDVLAKKVAQDWFNEKNTNFLKVCNFAELDPTWVIKKVMFAIENPRTWRRDCDLKNFFANKLIKK